MTRVLKIPRNDPENTFDAGNRQSSAQNPSKKNPDIGARPGTLDDYAERLVQMERDIKQERNQFEEDYDTMLGDLADQEEKLKTTLVQIRQKKREIGKRLNECIQVSSSLLTSIAETRKQEKELAETQAGFELKETESQTEAPLSVEEMKTEIKFTQKKLEEVKKQIGAEEGVVQGIDKAKSELSSRVAAVNEQKEELNAKKAKILKSRQDSMDEISRRKAKYMFESEQSSGNEIRLMAERLVLQKAIDETTKKIAQRDAEQAKFDADSKPRREMFAKHDRQLEDIRTHTKTFMEALSRRQEFSKGMQAAIDRTILREKEIAASRELLQKQLKKVRVDQFLLEEDVEDKEKQEIEIRKALQELEEELHEFTSEQTTIEEELEQVSQRESTERATEREFQKIVDMTVDTYNALKDRVKKLEKEEQKAIKKLRAPKQPIRPEGQDVDEARRRADVISRGYEAQICHTVDQCANLRKSIELEEMKVNLGRCEQKRIGTSIDRLSSTSFVSNRQDRSRIDMLEGSIRETEQRISDLRQKLASQRLSLTSKSVEIGRTSEQFPEPSKDDELISIQVGCEKRAVIAGDFCKAMEAVIPRIQKSIEEWKTGDLTKEGSLLKAWFQEISAIMDRVEDIEIRANIL